MYEMLDGLDVNREDYEKLRKRLETRNKAKLQETRIKVHSLQGAVKSIGRDVIERSLQVLRLKKTSPGYKNNQKYRRTNGQNAGASRRDRETTRADYRP